MARLPRRAAARQRSTSAMSVAGISYFADPKRRGRDYPALDVVYCELEPGDGLFFPCNTAARLGADRLEHRRWTLLCCYNRVDNDTFVSADDRYYVPLEKVPDGAVKAAGLRFASGAEHFA